jgi:hypothetical protein
MTAPASSPAVTALGNRALLVAKCSLCGLERPTGLMVPDGGEACDDLRWYCKDARSCTQRWTSHLREPGAGSTAAPGPAAAAPGPAAAAPGPERESAEPEPAEVSACQHA